jgi:hypothetical protein
MTICGKSLRNNLHRFYPGLDLIDYGKKELQKFCTIVPDELVFSICRCLSNQSFRET